MERLALSICVALCLIIVQCQASCEVKESKDVDCSAAADINEAGLQTEWTKIKIENSKLEPLLPNTFSNVPNLIDLTFIGAANGIKYNAFKDMHKLVHLRFFNCDFTEIKIGMLTNLPIVELLIYTSNVRKLTPRSFDNLPNLRNVYIHQNTISNIATGVFSYTNIELLYLNVNGIQTIEKEAFFGMGKLRTLALEGNQLISFIPALYVGDSSPLLNILWLARNNLTKITTDSYISFPKLTVLLMHFNPLRRLEENSFNGLQNLRYLDLSNNHLDLVSPKVFPNEGLALLDMLFLQNNRLTYLSSDIITKLPRLKRITIGGNPWQCVCYQKLRELLQKKDIEILCDEQYFEGKRPVCITLETNANICEYKVNKTKYLFDQFTEANQDYEKLPPLCKIYCENNKSCYSHNFDVLNYS